MSRRAITRRGFLGGIAAVGGVAATGTLTGCVERATGDTGHALLEELRSIGVARLAIGNEPPYTQIKTDGSVTGAEPEVARAVLKKMGINEVQGIITPYDAMIPGLMARQWDIITAGLYMNKSRCAEIIYSEPDIVSTESFAVRAGNPHDAGSIADLKRNPELRVAVLSGAYEDALLKAEQVPRGQITGVPDGRSGLEALQAGRVDVFLLPTLSLKQLVAENGAGVEITPPLDDALPAGSGAGFRPTDRSFRDFYNEKFAELKRSGEFTRIIEAWGFPAEEAMKTTAAELCQAVG